MKLPVAGGAYQNRSVNVNAQRCINFFMDVDGKAARTRAFLVGTPGLTRFVEVGLGPIRGMHLFQDLLYVVSDGELYSVADTGVTTLIGALLSTDGPVYMADNGTAGNQLMLVDDDGYGYIYNVSTAAFGQIASADFPQPANGVTFQDGYFIVGKRGTGEFYISGLYDGTSWDALDFATAEGSPDLLVLPFSDQRQLWLFGESSTEVWFNSGDADFPFARFEGGFMEVGCAAPASVCKFDNTLVWVTKDARGEGLVVRATGPAQYQIISPPSINYQISTYDSITDARAYTYQSEGHEFYVLTFPSADVTWVYDALTQEWHQRAATSNGMFGRHRSNCHAFAYNKHYVGDYENNRVYQLDPESFTDDGEEIIRVRSLIHINNDNNRVAISEFQLNVESGVGALSGQGTDPQIMLKWSRDGGHTFGSEILRSAGIRGAYGHRAVWRNLGYARDWVFWIQVSDPVKWILIDADVRLRDQEEN